MIHQRPKGAAASAFHRHGVRVPVWPLVNAFALVFLAVLWRHLLTFPGDAVDAHAYWQTDLSNLYRIGSAGDADAYLYAPPFAQIIAPLTSLPFAMFMGIWMAASIGALIFLVGPILAAILMFLVPWQQDVVTGNIHLLMTAAIVAGFRFPAAWSFVLLTKVTPGVALLWFAVRGEWRALALTFSVTASIGLVSFVIAPNLWFGWISMLRANLDHPYAGGFAIGIPLALRLAAAAIIVSLGAMRGWRWTVPLAAMLAVPILWYWNSLAMLAGIYAARRNVGRVSRSSRSHR